MELWEKNVRGWKMNDRLLLHDKVLQKCKELIFFFNANRAPRIPHITI